MTAAYVDAGWTGTPADVATSLGTFGFQVNADGSITTLDPTKAGPIVAVTGYRVLDGAAYVLIRSTQPLAAPSGITLIGPDHTAAISGVFMSDNTSPPAIIPSIDFFNRFTPAETQAIWAASVASPPIGAGLMNGIATGYVDLLSPVVKAWVDSLVTAGAVTSLRESVVLTP